MDTEVLPSAEDVARRAAALLAQHARACARERGRFLLAVSGGTTPRRMFERLADEDVPWARLHLFQVDERIVPGPDPARNLTLLRRCLLDRVSIPATQIHAMPVEDGDLDGAAARYAAAIRQFAGTPAILDLVHLGLGDDGHTASLVPGDPALDVSDSEVAVTDPYRGYRRMTLTYPVLKGARHILWVVTGSEKAAALARLRGGDHSIPAGRVPAEHARLLADADAAAPDGRLPRERPVSR